MKESRYNKDEYNDKYNREHSKDIQQYNQSHTTQIALRLSNDKDADIIEFLSNVPNKVDFIRQLIRDYMSKQ